MLAAPSPALEVEVLPLLSELGGASQASSLYSIDASMNAIPNNSLVQSSANYEYKPIQADLVAADADQDPETSVNGASWLLYD